MSDISNPLDIIKRLDVKQNVTIRVIDEPTGKVVQEHVGHNAATNSLLTGIAHYLMGDGVLKQGSDTLMMWVPQYISLGTMGLTSQESETITVEGEEFIVPKALGYTPVAPESATSEEKELNARLRFTEYINQAPGFGADGYDNNSNNNREWFGLGYPYSLKPDALIQDFYDWDGSESTFSLADTPITIISATAYPGGVINQDPNNTSVVRKVISTDSYSVDGNSIHFDANSEIASGCRLAVIYTHDSGDAANCELITAKLDANGKIVPLTRRSQITYRDLVPEIQSEVPNTLDVIYSAFVSVGALKDFRAENDYIYITEAGLWSKPTFTDSGDNGLLAGYRIMPSDDEVNILGAEKTITATGEASYDLVDDQNRPLSIISIDSITCDGAVIPEGDYTFKMTNDATILTFDNANIPESGATLIIVYRSGDVSGTWKDMTVEANRKKVQQSIIRVGVNQVAQIIWKIQLGGLEQLNGLRYLYPPQYPDDVWNIIK